MDLPSPSMPIFTFGGSAAVGVRGPMGMCPLLGPKAMRVARMVCATSLEEASRRVAGMPNRRDGCPPNR